ncbi:TPA: glutamyl-tRNA reductase [Candidatus Poribacteria bacterium]|jgi:glutamyl-tRNA reductase|nr:glutamyl-tRNA reductase [Candidatus Poribacteria bacterium]HIB90809.1 glutamyl-tRNA reductase [Candidatus Poribacteria bacterium]HIC02284.1 glutamyl-tRNA reductase [Candidatus Poribacteria bacterium]HIC19248.1 glutamyl-tRNA reductase [Candidatus Poribacteria bacterium]HIN30091.1 glutamyl-tRNA reductase [Candidatus Poribacteria bacterium]
MNKIAIIGTSHHTAPLEFREKLAFSTSELISTLQTLKHHYQIEEVAILSTCNRVELCAVIKPGAKPHILSDYLVDLYQINRKEFDGYTYSYEGFEAILHLFRVASSLDSMMIGESQILGQIKESYEQALSAKTTGQLLNRLFTKAIQVGKRTRTTTQIASRAVSISYVAVELAKKIFTNLERKAVTIIGAGEMGELAVRSLVENGASEVSVVNRTCERAERVAEMFDGTATIFDNNLDFLIETDIVISSTTAPHYLVQIEPFKKIMEKRNNRPIVMIDIAVPRDIDPRISNIENAFLYNIDDLRHIISSNVEERKQEAKTGEEIVKEEATNFNEYIKMLEADPTIKALHQHFDQIIERELCVCVNKANLSNDQEQVVRSMTKSIVKRLLHQPTKNLRQCFISSDNDQDQNIQILQELFELERFDNLD